MVKRLTDHKIKYMKVASYSATSSLGTQLIMTKSVVMVSWAPKSMWDGFHFFCFCLCQINSSFFWFEFQIPHGQLEKVCQPNQNLPLHLIIFQIIFFQYSGILYRTLYFHWCHLNCSCPLLHRFTLHLLLLKFAALTFPSQSHSLHFSNEIDLDSEIIWKTRLRS